MIDRLKSLLDKDADLNLSRFDGEWFLERHEDRDASVGFANIVPVDHDTDLEELLTRQGV